MFFFINRTKDFFLQFSRNFFLLYKCLFMAFKKQKIIIYIWWWYLYIYIFLYKNKVFFGSPNFILLFKCIERAIEMQWNIFFFTKFEEKIRSFNKKNCLILNKNIFLKDWAINICKCCLFMPFHQILIQSAINNRFGVTNSFNWQIGNLKLYLFHMDQNTVVWKDIPSYIEKVW